MSNVLYIHRPEGAECAVLGILLLYPERHVDCDLEVDHFTAEKHRAIYTLTRQQWLAGNPLDVVGLADLLIAENCAAGLTPGDDRAPSARVGGIHYMTRIPDTCAVTGNFAYYIRAMKDAANRRRLSEATLALQEAVGDPYADTSSLVAEVRAADRALNVAEGPAISPMEALAEQLDAECAGTESPLLNVGEESWTRNRDFGGLVNVGITGIVGASGMGKTSLLNRLTLGLASEGYRTHLHGSETGGKRRRRDLAFTLAGVDSRLWATRASALCRMSQNHPSRFDTQTWLNDARRRLTHAMAYIDGLPLTITGLEHGLSVDGLSRHVEGLYSRSDIDVVIVDYLQDLEHVASGGLKIGDMVGQTTYASTQLKALSGRCGDLPLIVGAQRSDEKSGKNINLRPNKWDTQYSSRFHQDCEELYVLYRRDYYEAEFGTAWIEKQTNPGTPGMIEVIGRKRRNGPPATLELSFHGPTKWVGSRIRGAM